MGSVSNKSKSKFSSPFKEGDDTILVRVVPAKSSRPPGRIQMNFEDLEKNREEELKKKAEEEKKKQYEENKRSFREVKRRSVVDQVPFQNLSLSFPHLFFILFKSAALSRSFGLRKKKKNLQRGCW